MTLNKIFNVILRRWYVVVIAALVCVAGAIIASQYVTKEEYTYTADVYVRVNVDNGVNEATITTSVMNKFLDLSKQEPVLEAVMKNEEVSVLGVDTETINQMVTISVKGNIFTVTAKSENKEYVKLIVNAYLDDGLPTIQRIVNDESIAIERLGQAREIESPSTLFKDIVMGGVIGLVIGILLALIPLFAGKVAHSEKELAEEYSCAILASVTAEYEPKEAENDKK